MLPLVNSSLLLVSLLGGLGLAALHHLGGGGLDDAHSHGLPHVTDSEPEQKLSFRRRKLVLRTICISASHLPRGG